MHEIDKEVASLIRTDLLNELEKVTERARCLFEGDIERLNNAAAMAEFRPLDHTRRYMAKVSIAETIYAAFCVALAAVDAARTENVKAALALLGRLSATAAEIAEIAIERIEQFE